MQFFVVVNGKYLATVEANNPENVLDKVAEKINNIKSISIFNDARGISDALTDPRVCKIINLSNIKQTNKIQKFEPQKSEVLEVMNAKIKALEGLQIHKQELLMEFKILDTKEQALTQELNDYRKKHNLQAK